MKTKTSMEIMLAVLLTSLFTFALNIQPVRSSSPFSDEFDTSTLDSRWTVVDPYGGSTLSLTANPGFLTIATSSPPDKDLFSAVNLYAPRVIQPMSGDFIIETKVLASFNQGIQSGGILVWRDANNFLRLERAFRNGYHEILFIGTINGVWSMPSEDTSNPGAVIHIANLNPTYLRLVRIGNTFAGYYSGDGVSWIHTADINLSISDPVDVGLYVVNRILPDSTYVEASFDYFRVSTPAVPRKLSVKLSGDFDYSSKEKVKVKLAALVKDVETMEAVSDANVTVEIYYQNGTLWVSDNMTERLAGTGIYEWESSETIYDMDIEDGIFLVHVKASVGDGPVASDMMLFHIDPPSESSTFSLTPLMYYVTAIAVIAAGTIVGIALLRKHRRSQITPQ